LDFLVYQKSIQAITAPALRSENDSLFLAQTNVNVDFKTCILCSSLFSAVERYRYPTSHLASSKYFPFELQIFSGNLLPYFFKIKEFAH